MMSYKTRRFSNCCFPSLPLTSTSLPLPVLRGTVTKECGMNRGTQEIGVEVLQEMEAPGVGQEGLSLVPRLGTHLTNSHPGGVRLNSLHGVKESPHFHHECRKNLLPDITMTDHLTPHIALTILRENILEVLHFTTTPINEFLHQLYKLIILPGVQANTQTLAHLNMASMGIHLTCAIDSILFKMTQVWFPTCPTLTCQQVLWLHWSK
ncbi:hypothetical protein GOODEAATRI_026173 [Goodea atripinnis]|uniref:Uncharacterized protein n=1 Tax=Goodea atripinnis TaxID=208336 RepID=A0ABV0NPY0_9TELE